MTLVSGRRSSFVRLAVACVGLLSGAVLVAPGCAPSETGGGSGGAKSSGGATGSGGATTSSGGAPGSGGAPSTSGGAPGSGGSSSGGAPGSGGSSSGGAPGSGGSSSGGAPGSGGAASGGRAGGNGGGNATGGRGGGMGGGNATGGAGGGTNPDAGMPTDAGMVKDGATMSNGAFVRTGWTATYTCTGGACPGGGDSPNDTPAMAFDGNIQSTRWSTNHYQQTMKNQFPLFFTVDMKQIMNISKITMHPSCRDIFDAPGALDVFVSNDGMTWGTAIVSNHKPAVPPNNEACPPTATAVATDTISFTTVAARYIQIKATQTLQDAHAGAGDRYWGIGEFNVYP